MTDVKAPLLVGEANPYGADPYFALYPRPQGATGDRLCRLIMGIPEAEYLRRFERVNLCTGRWTMKQARAKATVLSSERRTFVLLGSKVRSAFGIDGNAFDILDDTGRRFALLPHPSGLCRAWNDPANFDRAREVLIAAGVLGLPVMP